MEKTAEDNYGVERSFQSVCASWPSTPKDDLRDVLKVCEQEMDNALGVLLGSACNSLRVHVGLMIGETDTSKTMVAPISESVNY